MAVDMALQGNAVDGIGIRCDVTDEPRGGRRYILEVPASAVPRAQALIDDLLGGRYRATSPGGKEDIGASLAEFRRLLEQMS
jgi:hypothetical protein